MDISTKNVIIGCFLTAALSIPLTAFGTNAITQHVQGQNQNVVINIDGTEVAFDAQDIEDLNSKISNLESENKRLLDQIEENNSMQINDNADSNQAQNEIIYLNELPFFNCQFSPILTVLGQVLAYLNGTVTKTGQQTGRIMVMLSIW